MTNVFLKEEKKSGMGRILFHTTVCVNGNKSQPETKVGVKGEDKASVGFFFLYLIFPSLVNANG